MRPETDLRLKSDCEGRVFGPGPRELLHQVEETGSLSAAATKMGMAYTKALRLVKTAESAFGFKLVERRIGGIGGGGSQLTEEAKAVLERYDSWEREVRKVSEDYFASSFAGLFGYAKVGCVVMASGEAQRFGSQKLLASLAGSPLLAQTLAALPTDLLDVVVSTRWQELADLAHELGFSAALHGDPDQSASMRAGLEALGPRPGVIFVQGDQPLVSSASLRQIARQMALHPRAIVRLAWEGRPSSPVGWPADLLPMLGALRGDVGGASLLRQRPELLGRVILVEARDQRELLDVDTPEDLARIEELLTSERG